MRPLLADGSHGISSSQGHNTEAVEPRQREGGELGSTVPEVTKAVCEEWDASCRHGHSCRVPKYVPNVANGARFLS